MINPSHINGKMSIGHYNEQAALIDDNSGSNGNLKRQSNYVDQTLP